MLLATQLLYAAERAPITYWVGRGWAAESVCILEKREKLCCVSGFGGLGVSAVAFGTQVHRFKTGRRRRIFFRVKNAQRVFLQKGSKSMGPMSLIYGM
jgi:hypothetical protein